MEATSQQRSQQAAQQAAQQAYSVLLVDDDPVFLQTLCRSLQRKGLQVHAVETGVDAIDHLQREYYDLVLLDLNLAGESGLALLQEIKRQWRDQRVVMLTAYASIATAVEAIKQGADNYLCKPVNSTEVMALFDSDGDAATVTMEDTPLSVERLEWEHLQKVLMDHDGNISATARALNMHRRTLQRKLQKRPAAK
ncbi:response regulator transcription factor [Ketobacter sp.]|uniref:response regulator transcription factor n=1 Tax=Ketobacter sp. TaxID=2083498 RepID=UPI000F1683B0|nr:response regulator [Ketobacter sp.]RLU00812.1 MAG: response regulator [Ketobacter sp.]